MQEHPVLGHVALGYSPMIDRQRAVVATRITVFPQRPDALPDAGDLLAALLEVWPAPASGTELKLSLRPLDPVAVSLRSGKVAEPAAAPGGPPVSLNIAGEALLNAVMAASPPPHLMIEVPAFMATDPAHAQALLGLRDAGSVLLIKGRPLTPVAPEVLACFSHSIVEAGDDRRTGLAPAPGVRQVSTVQAGTRSSAEVEQAFARGAVAVLGWPFDDPEPKASGRSAVATDVRVVMDLIGGVDREEPVARLESILRRDPTLAFRLLRYLNSPAFGLSAEISSFSHAIMMLGYVRLKRWLAVLLASSSKGANARPLMHAAVRRGLLMEELARGNGDAEMRSEMFICGVFSLLDRLLQQPFSELLGSVPVPERVQQALRGNGGPYEPYLDLVRSIEQESVFDIRACAEKLMLGPAEINRAVLLALQSARQLDG
jgi:EAL and modified HD-GYP domain-containing signal transduction protein